MLRLSWPDPDSWPVLVERALALVDAPGRAVLGIAGAPGAGKSTLSQQLLVALAERRPGAVVGVGMDAFHLGDELLVRRGLRAVKGAPHTFDARGYVALLHRLRATTETVYAPEFRREIEDSIAQAVEVGPEVGLVVTEGNYLLVPDPPWDGVAALLDEAWFLAVDPAERRRRLVARRLSYGEPLEQAQTWAEGSDEANARVVDAAQGRVDVWIDVR